MKSVLLLLGLAGLLFGQPLVASARAWGTPVQEQPKEGDDVAVFETSVGKIVVKFFPDKAPLHVKNFLDLANKGFYDGTRFHRCIPGFMIQGGDPNSKDLSKSDRWGTGGNMVDGKEQTLKAEFNDVTHARGILSMARSQNPNSASSQFFICVAKADFLDHQYTVFGEVVTGMDVVDKIVKTGKGDNNGSVEPGKAVVIQSIKVEKWPIK